MVGSGEHPLVRFCLLLRLPRLLFSVRVHPVESACLLASIPYYLVGPTSRIYLPRGLAWLLYQKTVPAPAYQCLVAKLSGRFYWCGVLPRLDVVRISDFAKHCPNTGFTRSSSQYRRIIRIESFWQMHVSAHSATH